MATLKTKNSMKLFIKSLGLLKHIFTSIVRQPVSCQRFAKKLFYPASTLFFFFLSRSGGPGARFSKVPKPFGRISGDLTLFVSSKWRRLEARNFAVILIVIPFTTYKKTSFTELAGRSFTNGFSGPKSFRDFRETGPRSY